MESDEKKGRFLQTAARKLLRLCFLMLRIGCIGFGGGSALIPVMHKELVEDASLVTEEEFNKDVVVASITPGALPVEIAVGVGRNVAGIPGMILAATCIALPGVAMTVAASAFLAMFGAAIARQINFLAIGVSAYIIYVLCGYVRSTVKDAAAKGKKIASILTIAAVVVFTCGQNLCEALDVDWQPIFSVSTANAMAVAFFLIFFLRGEYHKRNVIPGFSIALAYLLCVGKVHLIPVFPFKYILQLVIVALSFWGLCQEFKGERLRLSDAVKTLAKQTGAWIFYLAALSIPAIFLFEDGVWVYLGKGCLSALISFGGGDAYLAVAGGMFVTGGVILRGDFYNRVVPTANAFPGSILCKVLSGIGYFAGYRASGSVAVGMLVALAGFAASVAASGVTFTTVACIYEQVERLRLFSLVEEVIRPIISGLLITVGLSFFASCMEVGESARWPDLCAPLLCVLLACGCGLFVKKRGIKPLALVLMCAGISITACNLFELFF